MSATDGVGENAVLTAVDLIGEPAPQVPREMRERCLSDAPLCQRQLQDFLECMLERKTESMCQEVIYLLSKCRQRRDAQLRQCVLAADEALGTPVARLQGELQQAQDELRDTEANGRFAEVSHARSRVRDLQARIVARQRSQQP
ncbi:hypothetical protein CDCA_CDCA07G2134 [Cyanidium caldarium]|uniref:DUF7803 domain-containing protein n=1 Tax=Cyanidium caldarium TaxID=2771 RepID=A0AAV9IV10_CYACA|nr:hypothetical protein CDCA_CDCA07G2134 [Cyanidium caldarium]